MWRRIVFTSLKVLLIVLILVVVLVGIWVLANFQDVKEFFPMPAGAYAYFMASSLWVEGRSPAEASSYSRLPWPFSVDEVQIDQASHTVTVKSWFTTATARWVDQEHGVVLQ